MFGSMSNVLQQQHRSMEIAANIMSSVNEIFAGLDRHAKFKATSTFMNLRQRKDN